MESTISVLPDLSAFWPEWTVREMVGQGSFGSVYKAECIVGELHLYNAVKVIHIPKDEGERQMVENEFQSPAETANYYQDMVVDFLREVQTLRLLKNQPGIVNMEDYHVQKEEDSARWTIYIRMEFLQSLTDYMHSNDWNEALTKKLGLDLCRGLISCKQANIIHRDIKPDNIFITPSGEFKLGDFGVARQLDRATGTLSLKGSPAYMAPEVFRGEKYNSTVDIYSLGMVLYRLTNDNREPFLPGDKQIITYQDKQNALEQRLQGQTIPPPKNASKDFAKVILKACAFKSDRRYQTPDEMYQDIWTLSDPEYLKAARKKKAARIALISTGIVAAASAVIGYRIYQKYRTYDISEIKNIKEIQTYKDNHTVYLTRDNTYGIVDTQGKVILKDWDYAQIFSGDVLVTFRGTYENYYLDENGEYVTENTTGDLELADHYDVGKYQLNAADGSSLTKLKWPEILVSKAGKYYRMTGEDGGIGIFDVESGKFVIEPKWNDCTYLQEDIFKVTTRTSRGRETVYYYRADGSPVFEEGVKDVTAFSQTDAGALAAAKDVNAQDKEACTGYINTEGEFVIPAQWTAGNGFYNGTAFVRTKDGCWGCIDEKGNYILEPTPGLTPGSNSDAPGGPINNTFYKISLQTENNQTLWTVFNTKTRTLFPESYAEVKEITDQAIVVVLKDGSQAVLNSDGDMIAGPYKTAAADDTAAPLSEYPYADGIEIGSPANDATICSRLIRIPYGSGETCTVIGIDGRPLAQLSEKDWKAVKDTDHYIYAQDTDNNWHCFDTEGKALTQKTWQSINVFTGEYLCLQNSNGQYELLDQDLNHVIDSQWDDIRYINTDSLLVEKDGIWKYLSIGGK